MVTKYSGNIIHACCIRSELLSDAIISDTQQEIYTTYNPKEQLRLALIIGKDGCLLFCGTKAYNAAYKTDKQHLSLIQYHYHSWGFSHIPVANGCASEV